MDSETHGERVKASILAAGLRMWRDTRECPSARAVGRCVGLTHSAVLYHFPSLRSAVASEAVRTGDAVIVPQLITAHDPAADALSEADRRRFLGAV